MKVETLHSIIGFLVKVLLRVEYIDPQNVPSKGGCIVATNHMSRLDIPILFATPGRDYITALAADKYRHYPFFRFILDTGKAVWIDRGNADFSAMRASVEYLRKGVALGIAPEGTRTSGALIEGKPGIALIAEKAQVPIVPVGIAGSESASRKLLSLKRAKIIVRYGQSFRLTPLNRDHREKWLKDSTDEIMCQIAALLPAIYHGVYAHHPRVVELLSGNPKPI
jgi:1-acyl-sn-glycerol-3-phosphate acyltransferase